MLRRDEVRGDLGWLKQECDTCGRSNKSLISLAGAAGLELRQERRLRCWLKSRKRNRGGIFMANLQTRRLQSIRTARGANRAMIRMFLTVFLTWCASTMTAAGADLYRTKVTVTGQGEANRMVGFAAGLEDVLIKASGAQKLSGDRRLAAYKAKARDYVRSFSYRDQFFGKPIRDEQGTRDRPFDLTVEFEESRIDDILKAFALKPWLSHRPSVAVFVEMEQGAKSYLVTTDGPRSDLQRDALLAAAEKRGMSIVLPSTAALAKSNITGA